MIKMNQINEGKKFSYMSFAIFVVICFTAIMTIVAITAKGENSSEDYNNGLGSKGITINWSETDDEGKVHTWYYERGLLVNYTIKEPGLTKGLVSYYKFEEISGDLVNSASNIDLTQYGIVGSSSGIIGNSRGTYSNDNYFFGNIEPTYPEGEWAISTWFNITTSSSAERYIFLLDAVNNYEFECRAMIRDDKLYVLAFTRGDPTYAEYLFPEDLTQNSWNHLVITQNSTGFYIYLNNVLRYSFDVISTSGNPADELGIGFNTAWLRDGGEIRSPAIGIYVDELGIWNRALTADEISELYNSGNGLSYPFEE